MGETAILFLINTLRTFRGENNLFILLLIYFKNHKFFNNKKVNSIVIKSIDFMIDCDKVNL